MKTYLSFLTIFFMTGCATVPYDQVLPEEEAYTSGGASFPGGLHWKKKRSHDLKEICERYGMYWQFDRLSQVVVLSKKGLQARALVGSPVVVFDHDGKIFLNEPLRLTGAGVITVPDDFHTKIVRYFDQAEPATPSYVIPKVRKVIIDAGHGGKDSGALGRTGLQEKDVVLDIAQRVGRLLKQSGMDVIYTRDRDDFISLQKRTEIASQEAADLFVSIHANSAHHRKAAGVEVFHLKPLNASERLEQQRIANEKALWKQLKIQHQDIYVQSMLSDLLYMNKQAESYTLARDLSYKISKAMRARNRGMKNSRFFVLRNTLVPAVLIEVGFLSNSQEEKKLKSSGYRQKLARSIAESLVYYARN